MKQNEVGSFQIVYDGSQNPTTKTVTVTSFLNAPLQAYTYDIVVSAFNWVGESSQSVVPLTFTV
jgi:hypothetical protein